MRQRWHKYRPTRSAYRGERRGSYPKILALLVGMAVMLVFLDVQLRPVVKDLTENQAKQTAVMAINQSVTSELNQENVTYTDLVSLEKASSGQVLAITTDMTKMNDLKAKITMAIQEQFVQGHTKVGIPMGTLMGSELLHGRGPEIPLMVTLAGNVTSEFKSSFESAGINQTKHQIYLEIHTSIYSFIPGVDTTTDLTTNVAVAETVIVGDVPQIMLQK